MVENNPEAQMAAVNEQFLFRNELWIEREDFMEEPFEEILPPGSWIIRSFEIRIHRKVHRLCKKMRMV